MINPPSTITVDSISRLKEPVKQGDEFGEFGILRGGGSISTRLKPSSSIQANPNSEVVTNPNPKPAPTTRGPVLKRYKSQLHLTQRQKEIAIGTLLGDASLQTQDKGATYRLKFQGSTKHQKYGEALYEEFQEFCLSEPATFLRESKNGMWSFQTVAHKDFTALADIFYDSNSTTVKRIKPNFVENHLSKTGVAYWFMDDGSKADHTKNEGKGIHFHTQGFTNSEVDELCSGLKKRYNFDCWRGKNKNKPIVIVSGKSYDEVKKTIQDDLHLSMAYKLPSERKATLRQSKSDSDLI